MKRQVVVVGAGPGGSTAAFYLAKAGVDVLLIDKETWPRDKPCGDGQNGPLFPIYEEMGIMEEIKKAAYNFFTGFAFTGPDEEYTNFDTEEIFSLTVPRRILDDIVRRAAVREDADWMENFEATELIIKKGVVKGIRGYHNNHEMTVEADVVVIADGAHSMLARQLNIYIEDPRYVFYGARGYFEDIEGMSTKSIELFMNHEIFFPTGYMWVFPQGGKRANVGVFITEEALRKSGMKLEDFFDWWRDNTKLGHERMQHARLISKIQGWRLPTSPEIGKNYTSGALLVGDACNSIDCAYGGGYVQAQHAGRIAGQVLADALKIGDVSEEALSAFHVRVNNEVNPISRVWTSMRDLISYTPEDINNFTAYGRSIPGYPKVDYSLALAGYYKDKLGVDLNDVMACGRDAYRDKIKEGVV